MFCSLLTINYEALQEKNDNHSHTPILALPDPKIHFSVFCDASDFAIGNDMLQIDYGQECAIAFKSRQLKVAVEK